jgi:hypothetical protein
VHAFVRRHDGRRNIYYSVNPTKTAMTKKAAKADIAMVEFLFADLDPADGETPDQAKARYLGQMFEPRPTAIVDSGNGIQALWKLESPIAPLGPEKIAEVEALTKALTLKLGGTAGTQDICRILRLPGTTNLPNKTKRTAGRVPCPTRLIAFNDARHPLSAFPASDGDGDAVKTSTIDETGSGHGFRFFRACNDRRITFEQALKEIRADDGPAGEWARRTDDRQIRRAWERSDRTRQIEANITIGNDVEESIAPTIMNLEEMEDRLVWIGTGAVADRVTGRVRKKSNLADEYAGSWHQRGKKAIKSWLASPKRKSVEVLAWVPGAPTICSPPEGGGPAFNTWRGLRPMNTPDDWWERAEPFLEHVAFLVPIEAERAHFLKWLAHIVQHPEVLPHTCYLMITPTQGIGRNLLGSMLVRALRGYVAANIDLPELLESGYTGRLSMKLLAIVDEVREGGGDSRYKRAQRFKSLVNAEHRHVNNKYGLQVVEKNACRWLMFSNHLDAIPFDNSDRRVRVVSNPTVPRDPAYYTKLYGMLDDLDFIGSIRRCLETLDISAFNPGEHAPMNAAKEQALDAMMTEVDRLVTEFKEENPTIELTTRHHIMEHVRWGSNTGKVNDTHLAHAIARAGMINSGRRISWEDHRSWIVIVNTTKWTVEMIKMADVHQLRELIQAH